MKYIYLLLISIFVIQNADSQNKNSVITDKDIAKGVLYEANIRQYSTEGTFAAFTKDLPKIKELGVNIIWLMPINPISTTKSKGPLGSYYAVSDYKKVNPEYGTLADLKDLVNQAHELGMYVILDWVPGHTGWDHIWLKENSDFYLKNDKGEVIDPIDPKTGESFGWTDVADLNYENMKMRKEMRESLLYWVEEANIDGFRIDQAYAVPIEFYKKTFKEIKKIKPVFLLAETDAYHPGGFELLDLFDASYDWKGHHLTKAIARGENNTMDWDKHIDTLFLKYKPKNLIINFSTNHDENSWSGTIEESFGKAGHAMIALNYLSPGMPLIYSGQEYDLNKRLLFFEKDSFPKTKGETYKLLKKLGALKAKHSALDIGEGIGDYTRFNSSRNDQVLAFQRTKGKDTVIYIANLSKEHVGFTMPINGVYKRFIDGKKKILSESYEYRMKPWEFWILTP